MKILKSKIVFFPLFIIFAIVAIFVRVHDFGKYPADINCDESMAAVESMAIVENGTDHLGNSYPVYFDAWGHGQMNALYSYLLTGFIKIFGVNTIVVRLPMLIFSLLGIAALTWIAWMIFSKEVALFVLGFAAINPWHIMLSRWALESNMFPHFLIIGMAFLFFSIKTGRKASLFIALLFYGLSLYGYGVAYSFVPLFLLSVFILLYISKTFRISTIIIAAFCFLAVVWPIVLMMTINLFKLPTITIGPITIQLFEKTTRMSDILLFSDDFWKQLLSNVQHLWNIVFLQKMDVWWNQLPTIGTMYKITLPFSIAGIIGMIQFSQKRSDIKKENCQSICIGILFINLAASLLTGLIINDVNVTRMNHIYYPLILVSGYGIYWIYTKKKFLGIVITACYGVYFAFFCYRYFYSEDRTFINYTYDKGLEKALNQAFEYPGEICISTHQYRNDYKITEINTLYLLKLPYDYYSGQMSQEELDSSGYILPYNKRIHYFTDLEATISQYGGQCVYVVNVRDRDIFDKNVYQVSSRDYFSVVVPYSKISDNK